ncbi:MAG: LPS export ABC transporter periplasmic protein LptC [Lyngbya sp.]|nr:LPS export ABC transporter periplasmic protein LptC [Lyngbya sp.]
MVGIILLAGLSGCTPPERPENNDVTQTQPQPEEEFDNSLTLDDVTLEQANEKGELLWRVESKQASYSKDNRIAKVTQPMGELFRDGKLLYKVEAELGEVYQDSKRIVLRNNIVATDVERGLVLRGNFLEWIVDQEILVVRNGVTGEHEQVHVVASEVQAFNREKRIEFWNQVTVNLKDPVVQLRTDHIIWEWEQEKLIADRRVEVDRYQQQTVTDRGVAGEAIVDLKTQLADLKKNVQIAMSEPPLQIASNQIKWLYEQQKIESPQPITIIHREEQVTVTANQGWGDLKAEQFDLVGNVVGIGQKRQAQLNTNQLTWSVSQQQFQAQGNVVYRQIDPPLTLMGDRAVGEFTNNTIVVSGGQNGDQVVTEFVP